MSVLGYCLMNNHVHVIAVPEREDSLSKTLARTHSEYASSLNRTQQRSGHLWQNRFFSCPMGPTHLHRAMLYVDLNPVRAGLVKTPEDWEWSSARVHASEGLADPLMQGGWSKYFGWWDPSLWQSCLRGAIPDEDLREVRRATVVGEPLGTRDFLEQLEHETGKTLKVSRRGRPTGKKPV
jgi:putative transposase